MKTGMGNAIVPATPGRVPRSGNGFTRWLGRTLRRLAELAELTGDHEADLRSIRVYYSLFTGRNPRNQSP